MSHRKRIGSLRTRESRYYMHIDTLARLLLFKVLTQIGVDAKSKEVGR